MQKKFPIHPAHPERICWGCNKYCPSDSMQCGNGSNRTQHPYELLGEDWQDWFGVSPEEAKEAGDAEDAEGLVFRDMHTA